MRRPGTGARAGMSERARSGGMREAMGRPWVERWPDTHDHEREDTKGLVEWEDHGPIEWLGDKIRELISHGVRHAGAAGGRASVPPGRAAPISRSAVAGEGVP
jgi:hypothetical protein